MRRALVAPLLAAAVVLAGCSSGHPSVSGGQTLYIAPPNLVKLKKQTQVPDCPKVSKASVSGGLPSITLACLGGGRPVDVAGLRGPLLLNYWASWCSSCHEELPALAAYARSQTRVRVLGVDYLDPHPDAALELAKNSDVAYPLVEDPKGDLDRASPLPQVPALPITVFIAADGTIAHVESTAYTSKKDVAEAAQKYLGTSG